MTSSMFRSFSLRLTSLLSRLTNLPLLIIVQRSFSICLPIILLGAFCLTLRHFPFTSMADILRWILGPAWAAHLDNLIAATTGIVSLAMICSLSGVMAMAHNQKKHSLFVSPVMAITVSLSCLLVLSHPQSHESWTKMFSMTHGLLPALVMGITSCGLFLHLVRYRFFHWPMGAAGHDPFIRDIFTVIPAAVATIVGFFFLHLLLVTYDINNINDQFSRFLVCVFADAGDSLSFALSYTGLSQFLWFLGAHGPNLLYPLEEQLLTPGLISNTLAFSQNGAPDIIFTKAFFDAFTRLGGSGSTLCLIIAMVWKSRDLGSRKLCLFALLPGLFNVNEPLLFGIPLVLNPTYIIPFFIVPQIQTLLTYLATSTGLVPMTINGPNWTTPIFLSGFIATASTAGVFMQAINLLVGALIYAPFVKMADNLRHNKAEKIIKVLLQHANSNETSCRETKLINLTGEPGRFAKCLADDLNAALHHQGEIYLVYQPQIATSEKSIIGAEALLRWQHPVYGQIPPPITVALAEDLSLIDQLGQYILVMACRQRAAWAAHVPDNFCMSVNVSPRQLNNSSFATVVLDIIKGQNLNASMIKLEITESTVIESSEASLACLDPLQQAGIKIAIDDFGMGHASLRYLRSFPVNTIKIDRSFTMGQEEDINHHIVRSVIELSQSLGIETIIEGVESQQQVERFCALGCTQFQGYYFSRPLAADDCLKLLIHPQNLLSDKIRN